MNFQAEPFGEAATGGQTLYQSRRTADGWQTRALTPRDVLKSKLFGQTAALFFTPELTQTIFTTEQPLVNGDQDQGALDLYEESREGTLTWVSQGNEGGTGPNSVTYDGATPDGNHVFFDSTESLVPAATGLEPNGYRPSEYLYERNVSDSQTTLVNLNNEDKLLNSEGAILGNGNYLTTGEPPVHTFLPADYFGTTTHAISEDGSKVFFESPPPSVNEFKLDSVNHVVHLYMRKNNSVTVALDNPAITTGPEAGVRYLGASANGSYVFFVSDEGLAGNQFTDPELYVYDTEAEKLTAISVAPQGSPPVDGDIYGVIAIANDGSRVYYDARGVLATNTNARGQSASEGQPNLYVYNTATAVNTFITQLGQAEVEPEPGEPGRLVSYLDVERPAVPTPNGQVLVLTSEQNLTGQNATGTPQIYRYDAATEDLICISCDPKGTGGSSLAISGGGPGGAIGGGSYDPPGQSAPMSETGDRIFFETENALVPEDQNSDSPPSIFGLSGLEEPIPNDIDVYEWESGHIHLISSGKTGITSLQSVSPSGDDVFFNTSVNLTGQTSSGFISLYDARVNGGFGGFATSSEQQASCDGGESCRGPVEPAPRLPLPASAILQDAVNLTPVSKAARPVPAKKPAKIKKRGKGHTKVHKKAKKAKKARKASRVAHITGGQGAR